jgi:hypothetical protein
MAPRKKKKSDAKALPSHAKALPSHAKALPSHADSRTSLETYTDLVYGSPRGIGNNNCYAYAIGHYRDAGGTKLQPGDLSPGRRRTDLNLQDCESLRRRVAADLGPDARSLRPGESCGEGWHAAHAYLDPGKDYHWYRKHKDVLVRQPGGVRATSLARRLGVRRDQVEVPDPSASLALVRDAGLYSHKRGLATGPLLEDSCGKPIRDPDAACKDYASLNYTKSCGGFCIRDKVRTNAK